MRLPDPLNLRFNRLLTIVSIVSCLTGSLFWADYTGRRHALSGRAARPEQTEAASSPVRAENGEGDARRVLLREAYGKRLLSLELNAGQTDAQVKFLAGGDRYGMFLTS